VKDCESDSDSENDETDELEHFKFERSSPDNNDPL